MGMTRTQSSAIQIYLFITENMILKTTLKTTFLLKYLYHKKLEARAMITKHNKGCKTGHQGATAECSQNT